MDTFLLFATAKVEWGGRGKKRKEEMSHVRGLAGLEDAPPLCRINIAHRQLA